MRILISLMGHPDAFKMATPLLRALPKAGFEVLIAPDSAAESVPIDDLAALGIGFLPLADGGPTSIPRLSRRQYRALCGDDLDFLSLQYHNLARSGFRPTRETLDADSMFHQWHMGAAYRAECLFRAVRPDALIVHQGSEPISKLMLAKAAKLGIPALRFESPFVPGKLLLDDVGMHFLPGSNRLARDWPGVRDVALDDAMQARLDRDLSAWKSGGISKYEQTESAAEVADFDRFRAAADEAGDRLLFVVDQVPWDANVVNGLAGFRSLSEMVAMANAKLPEGWRAVLKLHPKNPEAARVEIGPRSDRYLVARDLSIHRLLDASAAVLTFSSNVGMEALIYDRPVLVAGRPHYGRLGLTLDLDGPTDFAPALRRAETFSPDHALRDRFLSHVLFRYLLDADDTEAIRTRIEAAEAESIESVLAVPCSGFGAGDFSAFRDLAVRYDRLASGNLAPDEIARLLRLPSDSEASTEGGWSRLDSGERQVAVDFDGIAADHLVRYQLARGIVRPGDSVLDLSCGIGYGTYLLAAETGADRVLGVDCSSDAVMFAQEFWGAGNVAYEMASAGSFGFEGSAFDLIVSFETVEHLANDESFIRRAWHALRPGGCLLISAPHQLGYPMTMNHPFHVAHYSANGLEGLVSGFEDLAESAVIGQVGESRIEAKAEGRHLILAARKAGGEVTLSLAERLANLLPLEGADCPPPARGSIRFRAHRFRSEQAPASDGAIWADETFDGRCVAHGPYRRLAPGEYTAAFLLAVDGEPDRGGEAAGASVVLDVADAEGRPLTVLRLRAPHLRALAGATKRVVLPFRHRKRDRPLQFRATFDGRPIRGRLGFFGVEVKERLMSTHANDDPFADAVEALDLAAVERREAETARARLDALAAEFAGAQDGWARADSFFQQARAGWEERFREQERRLVALEAAASAATWERDQLKRLRAEWESERTTLLERIEFSEGQREGLTRLVDLRCRERDGAKWQVEDIRGELDKAKARASEVENLLAEVQDRLVEVGRERAEAEGRLSETEGRLRPYLFVDRAGVVPKGFRLAGRMRRRSST